MRALLFLLLAGCGGEEIVPLARSWGHTGPVAIGVDVALWVPQVRVLPEGEGSLVELELVLENIDRGLFDGTRAQRGGVAVDRGRLRLVADGVAVTPAALDRPGWLGVVIEISPEGTSFTRGWLSFSLQSAPRSLVLEVPTPHGLLRAPVLGGRVADGARPLVLLGPDDRVVLGPPQANSAGAERGGWVKAGGEAIPAPAAPSEPWLVPAGVGQVEVAAPGWAPQTVEVPAGEGPVVARLVPLESRWKVAPASNEGREGWDLEALSRSLHTADEVVAFVRDHIRVLPTTGLQRSPTATLRQGAGGPVDRAELARALLRRLGLRVEIACGDLPAGQLEALVGATAPAAGHEAVTAGMPGERSATRRETTPVVPEWCDVALDGEARPRDLRPPEALRRWSTAPAPPVVWWTSRASINEALWKVDLNFRAVLREGADVYRTVDLIGYETDAPTLSDRGFLFDLSWEIDPEGRKLRPMLSVVTDRDVSSQLGTAVLSSAVERVLLDVTWRDPLQVSSITRSTPVWERLPGEELDALRAVVTGDAGVVPPGRIAEEVRAAYAGRWSAPAAHLLVAGHDLLAREVVGVSPLPLVRMTVLQDLTDGRRTRRVEQLPAVAMSWEERAQIGVGLVQAVMKLDEAAGLGAGVPLQPVRWASTVDAMLQLGFRDQATQTRARREVEAGVWVGVEPEGRAWRYEPDTGGVAAYGVAVPASRYEGEQPAGQGPTAVHARWEVPVLCDGVGRFAGLGVEAGEGVCRVAPARAP